VTHETSHATAPTQIERALTLDILRGRYPPGTRLPTVRELAQLHAVNPATIQRAVARLETRGLVTARQGSGLRVNDPAVTGELSLLPLWLEATITEPVRAVAMLADFLELRRVLATRLIVRHREAVLAQRDALVAAIEAMEGAGESGPAARRDADVAFGRGLLQATGHVVALGLFNTMAQVLEALPLITDAMYAAPTENGAAMRAVLAALEQGGGEAEVEAVIAAFDRLTCARLAERLAGEVAS